MKNYNCNCNCNCDCDCTCDGVGSGNTCDALMMQIYQSSFAMNDVVLYLDTHPCDQDALNYFYYVSDLRKKAVKAYEENCGPLMVEGVMDENYWTWVNDPWPWEGVCG
ncbi:spore coat protein CotJB [Clostridium sp. E02]|uniref:spore coat protein CotJB n=1 Tax=Clostridium sp. E02 TaxID=2487134 RepID=UPI000F5411A6